MDEVSQKIEALSGQAAADLERVKNAAELEQYRIQYLGANGQLKAAMKWLGQVPKEQKPALGQQLNSLKEKVTAAFEAKKGGMSGGVEPEHEAVDVTEPGARPARGARHLVMQVADELTELFARMGFSVAAGAGGGG